jgi:hypothetical protein
MRPHFLHRSFLLAFPLAILSVPAFSQAPSPAPADATDAARVQAFLDARYKASDVRYSFHTRAGQDIDCVDFFAEPGVKALAARGRAVTIPKPPALPEELAKELEKRAPTAGPRPEDDFAFHGQPDVNGNPEKCPDGSVPEVRITAEEIARAGGLDEYMRRWEHKVPPPRVIRRDGNNSTCGDSTRTTRTSPASCSKTNRGSYSGRQRWRSTDRTLGQALTACRSSGSPPAAIRL